MGAVDAPAGLPGRPRLLRMFCARGASFRLFWGGGVRSRPIVGGSGERQGLGENERGGYWRVLHGVLQHAFCLQSIARREGLVAAALNPAYMRG